MRLEKPDGDGIPNSGDYAQEQGILKVVRAIKIVTDLCQVPQPIEELIWLVLSSRLDYSFLN